MTADDILAALIEQSQDKIFAVELAFSQAKRRCDFWTLHPNPSTGFYATAYEIKISRQDFKRDTAEKQREARLYSDRFFYVAPKGLLKKEDIPDWAGLIEFDGEKLRQVLRAPHRDKDGPSWEFVVALIRSSGKINRDMDVVTKRLQGAEWQLKQARKKLKDAGFQPWQFGITD